MRSPLQDTVVTKHHNMHTDDLQVPWNWDIQQTTLQPATTDIKTSKPGKNIPVRGCGMRRRPPECRQQTDDWIAAPAKDDAQSRFRTRRWYDEQSWAAHRLCLLLLTHCDSYHFFTRLQRRRDAPSTFPPRSPSTCFRYFYCVGERPPFLCCHAGNRLHLPLQAQSHFLPFTPREKHRKPLGGFWFNFIAVKSPRRD